MAETVIKAENLSKMYHLGVISNGTLFRDIQSWWALKHNKEDPHAKIGANKYTENNTEFWALKDLNLEIKQGDRVGIIGKNGAGKSTLLKILSRITTPTEGCVKIRGKVSSLLEVGTGFHGELTGRENIYLNGAILGMKKREIDRKLDEIIDFSSIEKHIDTPVKRYSSGMYVRLAFAVAAHLDSDILIADEVLAVGDAEFQKKAIGKMSDLSTSQGRTVLFVSHNMAAVKALCNKGFVLEKGRIKFQSDSIDEAIGAYLTVNENSTDKIAAKILRKHSSISIDAIKINGSENGIIQYAHNDTLTIDIEGNTANRQKICIELRIKNELGSYLAYYNQGHFIPQAEIEKGHFHISETLRIPNIITGRYFVDLYLINPCVDELLFVPDAFIMNALGIDTLTGVALEYSDVGFVKLE